MKTPPEPCVPADPFSSPEVCAIFEEYRQGGGDVERLKHVVRFLSPKASKGKRIPPRAWEKTLRNCRESIAKALALDGLHVRVRCSLTRAAKDLDVLRAPTLSQTDREEIWSQHPRERGRPPGPTLPSLIPAILAEEFRKRFKGPRFSYVLTLVQAAAPNVYPQTYTPERITERIDRFNADHPDVAKRERDRLFP